MKLDIFLSICQTEVRGFMPSEKVMFLNFFDQIHLADQLGFGVAWVAETHLSCQIQKRNPGAVIPHFTGEIGLNTDILQLAHIVFSKTKKIHIGSAIRNILCNGGPMAHAEAIRTFLSYHSLNENENRGLHIGFAAGRFPFSNVPYGIIPRNAVEKAAWPAVRGKIFLEATEIFLRFLRGDIFNSSQVTPKTLKRADFRSDEDWQKVIAVYGATTDAIVLKPNWTFDDVGVIPFETPLENLRLVVGSHDPISHVVANQFMPCGVFNLSITPDKVIEQTHERMKKAYHPKGGEWTRAHMPRTVLVFINEDRKKAELEAKEALENYWKAIEGTLDPEKVQNAVGNALVGTPNEITEQLKSRFHPEDRLMLWFDFNNHDNQAVKNSMKMFMEKVAPNVQ
jgi:alkanesulfonate monooxygenase SsuD/methylene tetrahydromethanopterin reductase-like flavin-dependent oxidoreductase (luciferase family)